MINSKKICLLGDPVEHSLSPVMHNAAFSKLGLDFVYEAWRVEEEELGVVIKEIKTSQIKGANITIPHKVKVMKFLDEIDDMALKIGAVNTIVNDNGKLKGFNTDALGFSKAMEEQGVKLKDKKIVLFGAGGVARAIAFQSVLEGGKLVIINRTLEKAEEIKNKIKFELKKEIEILALLDKGKLRGETMEADIIINATSLGMFPQVNGSVIPSNFLHPDLAVMDLVYSPIETKLLRESKEIGCKKIINGIEMLVHQGALSFEIWTGRKAPIDLMRKVVLKELKKRR